MCFSLMVYDFIKVIYIYIIIISVWLYHKVLLFDSLKVSDLFLAV